MYNSLGYVTTYTVVGTQIFYFANYVCVDVFCKIHSALALIYSQRQNKSPGRFCCTYSGSDKIMLIVLRKCRDENFIDVIF